MCLSTTLRLLPKAPELCNLQMKMMLEDCLKPVIHKLKMVQDQLRIDDFFLASLVAESVISTEEKNTILDSADDNQTMQDRFFSILAKNKCDDETVRVVMQDTLKQNLQHKLAAALLQKDATRIRKTNTGSYNQSIEDHEERQTIELRKMSIILDFMAEMDKFSTEWIDEMEGSEENPLKNFAAKLLNAFIIALQKTEQGHVVTLDEVLYCYGRRRSYSEEDPPSSNTTRIMSRVRRNSQGNVSDEFQENYDQMKLPPTATVNTADIASRKNTPVPPVLEASVTAFLNKHGKKEKVIEEANEDAPMDVQAQPWYYYISAGDAYKLLMRPTIRNGSFLVRPSISSVDFTLTWKSGGKVINTKIVKRKGKYQLRRNHFQKADEPTAELSTLADLIEHCVSNGKGKETVTGNYFDIMYPLTAEDIMRSCNTG